MDGKPYTWSGGFSGRIIYKWWMVHYYVCLRDGTKNPCWMGGKLVRKRVLSKDRVLLETTCAWYCWLHIRNMYIFHIIPTKYHDWPRTYLPITDHRMLVNRQPLSKPMLVGQRTPWKPPADLWDLCSVHSRTELGDVGMVQARDYKWHLITRPITWDIIPQSYGYSYHISYIIYIYILYPLITGTALPSHVD